MLKKMMTGRSMCSHFGDNVTDVDDVDDGEHGRS